MNRAWIIIVVVVLTACGSTQVVSPLPPLASVSADVDPSAPRRLLAHDGDIEIAWLAGTELRLTGGRGTVRPGALAARGRALLFDAARDLRGVYHVAAVIHVDDRVEVVAGRFDGRRWQVGTLARVSAVGGRDTHGDGIVDDPRPEAYESLVVVGGASGSTRVVWTDGRATFVGVFRQDGSADVAPRRLPARRVAAAADAAGRLHVLGVGQAGCATGGVFCNDHVVYAREEEGEWSTTELGSAAEESPAILVSRAGEIRALRAAAAATVLDVREPDHQRVIRPGPTDGEPFTWSTLVDVAGRPWLIAVSRLGMVHALSVANVAPAAGRARDTAPLLDLFSLPADAAHFEAVASDSEVVIAWSTPGGVHMRRARLPSVTDRLPVTRVWEVRPEQVPLTNGVVFADVQRSPRAGFWAGSHVSAGPDCVHPLAASVRASASTVVLPSTTILRLAHPTPDGWEIEERRLERVALGEPHQQLTAPSGWSLQTDSAGCPGRRVAYAPPGPGRTHQIRVSPDARWVAIDDRTAHVAVSGRLLRIVWAATGEAETASRVEPLMALPDAVDLLSIRVRDGVVAYGAPREELAVVGGRRLHADGGAFAVADDGTVIVRDRGRLVAGHRALITTDAVPLAAARRAGDLLLVALRSPRGGLVVAEFAAAGGVTATFVHACARGEIRAAQFAGDRLLVGCDR